MQVTLTKEELIQLYNLAKALHNPSVNRFFNSLFASEDMTNPYSVAYTNETATINVEPQLASDVMSILAAHCGSISSLINQPVKSLLPRLPKIIYDLKNENVTFGPEMKGSYRRSKERCKINTPHSISKVIEIYKKEG